MENVLDPQAYPDYVIKSKFDPAVVAEPTLFYQVEVDEGLSLELVERNSLDTVNKPFIRNAYNGRFIKPVGELNYDPSMAVPDQAMGIAEIYRRFANGGVPPSIQKEGIYDYDEAGVQISDGLPDLSKMDLVDADNLAKEQIEAVKARLNEKAKKMKQKGDKSPNEPEKELSDDPKPDSDPNAGAN